MGTALTKLGVCGYHLQATIRVSVPIPAGAHHLKGSCACDLPNAGDAALAKRLVDLAAVDTVGQIEINRGSRQKSRAVKTASPPTAPGSPFLRNASCNESNSPYGEPIINWFGRLRDSMTPEADGQNPALLRLDGLELALKPGLPPLLDQVGLTLNRGETLCIVGESGCGKSLTSLAIMGLLPPTLTKRLSGRMRFDGAHIALDDQVALTGLRGRRIGMIFQEPMSSLNPAYRIGDQIAEGWLRHNPGAGREAGREQALAMLRRVGIPAPERRLRDYPHQMSGGMRQRVMIAMALVNNPDLLIADEPTTALDVTVQAQILDLIAELQAERAMGTILITHDLGVVAEIADSVAVMYAGRIVETGPAAAIFADPQHPYTIGLMSSIPSLRGRRTRLATVPGMVPSVETMPEGCRFSTRCPFARALCASTPPLVEITPGHRAACHFAPLDIRLEGAA